VSALSRRAAVGIVLDALSGDDVVVFTNGFIARDGCAHRDSARHFYMLGSMGLAGAVGLGVAVARPSVRVVVLDGDGAALMGLGVLPMIGAWRPVRFLHVVLDNGTYGSTGAQPTISGAIDFPAVALASGYRQASSVDDAAALTAALDRSGEAEGPALLHVRIDAAESSPAPRVPHEPEFIAARFAEVLWQPAR
jgi:phosphonopyruvate decarboxylase